MGAVGFQHGHLRRRIDGTGGHSCGPSLLLLVVQVSPGTRRPGAVADTSHTEAVVSGSSGRRTRFWICAAAAGDASSS